MDKDGKVQNDDVCGWLHDNGYNEANGEDL